ncbi:AAA family ATPase [Thauera humireducens]|uniref:AAA family ATPase n=1 Tax=Thauera humireducens TaxID=1134435 RepID=UPI003C736EC7
MIGQPLDIRRALTEKPEPIDYVLPSLPARCLGALVAPGGVGKSSLVTQISVEMALGLPLVGGIHAARAPGEGGAAACGGRRPALRLATAGTEATA